ncbi:MULTISPECIES: helix-turn-helix domain-containing protein [Dethiosulfovibrio]|uniref:Resolvase HTH domain-containing protein n=2 Tax=Dethiosulfovibrio TaxID=47054 RepID=A0ABS9EPM0_9BACT|nr:MULTISPECIES: helix-turn-helix domain-containing protein [Dethiosulfovibrio]MCF4114467.1 hypothetical protein [Dethiosulfovibrio russensis]MCF4143144.1 hypothetical protein [Dethiosulfovibrio marinus]
MQRKNLLQMTKLPRVPFPCKGINVNFCKNPACSNFGVPAQIETVKRGRGNTAPDGYILTGSPDRRRNIRVPMLRCKKCNEYLTLKSNFCIVEEFERISAYLNLTLPKKLFSCPEICCPNNKMFIDLVKWKSKRRDTFDYVLYGKTPQGTTRVKCQKCGKVFSPFPKTSISRQRKSHINKTLFSLLMNKSPIRRICEILSLSPSTVYRKIDFIHRQCLGFVAKRENEWAKKGCQRVYVSLDRQDYTINWKKKTDRRNVVLSAIGSADNETGYVFGMHLNYNPSLDRTQVNEDALHCGEAMVPLPFRKYAHLWLDCDYEDSIPKSNSEKDLLNAENDRYNGSIDAALQDPNKKCPSKGMQVHSEYTLYAHFFLLRHFFQNVDKVRLFLDQDSGMKAGALGAFCDSVKARTCDVFYVRINKDMTIDERKHWFTMAKTVLKVKQSRYPNQSESNLRKGLMKEAIQGSAHTEGKWVLSPSPSMDEPEKAICYLTDYGDYDEDHLANLYNKASLRGIDRFFMQVRRRISLLERPIGTSSNAGRMWYGYSAYNPAVVVKLLDIFRVFYNYTRPGKDKMTPAMRIGMAKSVIGLDEILYY